MSDVLLALCPGAVVMAFMFGPAVLFQILFGVLAAITAEALALWLRNRPIQSSLRDLSAILTGVLLALSIPPLAPWWIVCSGAVFSILVGKQVYGGLGQNPFNPAMVGFAFLMLSFPRWMTLWPSMHSDFPDAMRGWTPLTEALFGNGTAVIDAVTRATPLTQLHDAWRAGLETSGFSLANTSGWVWINLAYLAGGVWLFRRNIIDKRIVLGMVLALAGGAAIIEMLSSGSAFVWSSLLLGSTMMGIFFIATDPVSAANTPRGRWIYGAGIGGLMLLIRRYGGYPDGLAFAVLTMNFIAPTIDRLTTHPALNRASR